MKFRYKIAISMLCLLSLLFGIGGSLLISVSSSDSLKREKDIAVRSYQLVANMLQAVSVNTVDEGNMADMLAQLSERNSAWTMLCLSSEGRTIYAHGAISSLSQRVDATSPTNICRVSQTQADGVCSLMLSGNFSVQDRVLFLDMTYDVTAIYETRERQQAVYRGVFSAMLALCAILSYNTAWAMTKPLTRLSRATKQLAAGNLKYRSKFTTNDEFGQVTADFNSMAERLEDNMHALRESMERQNRFVGSFAHELKTPMTSVIGYADLLRNGMLAPEESRDAANYIFTEGKRLERLSIKLLDLLVLEQRDIAFKKVDIARAIEQVMAAQMPVCQKDGIDLVWECAEGLCLVEPDLFASLLLNLMDNARKAIERDGLIKVSCEMISGGCRLSVEDDGRGIPESALPHLEEAFYRVDKARSRKQGGAGLGLALCHEIVRIHNGTMRFESTEGRGAKVTVELKGGMA